MGRIDISSQGTAHVAGGSHAKNSLAGFGIIQPKTVWRIFTWGFMAHPELLARTVGVHIGQVQGITMTITVTPQAVAVVVDGAGAVDHFVFAVAVYIANGHLVVALTAIGVVGGITGVLAVEFPAQGQLAVPVIVSGTCQFIIIATTNDQAGTGTIQVGYS
jgi:hypothetical protein